MNEEDLWLLEVFEEKRARNQQYSLRAFAGFLDVSPSLLSRLFNGEQNISINTATKILDKLELPEAKREGILSEYQEIKRKDEVIRLRVKRILMGERERNVKNLNGDEFLRIADWEYTFLYRLIDTIPLKIKNDYSRSLEFLSKKSSFSKTDIEKRLSLFEELGLLKVLNQEIVKEYDEFLFQGREKEAAIEDLKKSFADSSRYLSSTGASAIYPRLVDGKVVKKASSLSGGINLLNWDFCILSKDTAFAIEKLIESMYADIQKISKLESREDAEVYCISSQFFKASYSIDS